MGVITAFPICLTRRFAATERDVAREVAALEMWLIGLGCADAFIGDVTLVTAEALNNVVEHAFKALPKGEISTGFTLFDGALEIDIKDGGAIYNGPPPPRPMTGPEQKLKNMPEGGFGWFMIHALTSEIIYSNASGQNHLRLKMVVP